MKKPGMLLSLFTTLVSFGQGTLTEQAAPIVEEGKRLYRSEMASWHGTDAFLEYYANKANIGGYFSYSENDASICIFFSKDQSPKVIGEISFDSTFLSARIDTIQREFTPYETELFQLRKNGLEIVRNDTLFKTYENTNFNIIPLISEGKKKVYVLTGPKQSGVVILGNDYLMTFDDQYKLVSKKQLHRNIIPIYYEDQEGKEVEGSMHSHLPETGDFITATDICTLMLYGKFAKWKQHNVISKNYLNIWNCHTNRLVVIPMATVEKINKDQ